MALNKELSVGAVSSRSGLSVPTIHFYEAKGLIDSTRNASNHRRYPRGILRRLAVIKVAQMAGVPLRDIKEAMDTLPDELKVTVKDWSKLAKHWRSALDDRINRLTRLRDTMGYCIGCGCLSVTDCELMNNGDKLAKEGTGPRLLDPLD